jgi:ParB-like chromosome segregation protein Spo0J
MKILNPNDLPTIDYRVVREFQGDLKDLHHNEQEKLKRVLEARGFDVPFFVWKNREDDNFYLLDGHQRQRVMKLYDMNDGGNYEVPIVQIAAADVKTAKERLLEITSQYGRITREGLDEFADLAELELDDLDINFDAITDFPDEPKDEPEPKVDKPKELRFTIEDLKFEAAKFAVDSGLSENGFVSWLEKQS